MIIYYILGIWNYPGDNLDFHTSTEFMEIKATNYVSNKDRIETLKKIQHIIETSYDEYDYDTNKALAEDMALEHNRVKRSPSPIPEMLKNYNKKCTVNSENAYCENLFNKLKLLQNDLSQYIKFALDDIRIKNYEKPSTETSNEKSNALKVLRQIQEINTVKEKRSNDYSEYVDDQQDAIVTEISSRDFEKLTSDFRTHNLKKSKFEDDNMTRPPKTSGTLIATYSPYSNIDLDFWEKSTPKNNKAEAISNPDIENIPGDIDIPENETDKYSVNKSLKNRTIIERSVDIENKIDGTTENIPLITEFFSKSFEHIDLNFSENPNTSSQNETEISKIAHHSSDTKNLDTQQPTTKPIEEPPVLQVIKTPISEKSDSEEKPPSGLRQSQHNSRINIVQNHDRFSPTKSTNFENDLRGSVTSENIKGASQVILSSGTLTNQGFMPICYLNPNYQQPPQFGGIVFPSSQPEIITHHGISPRVNDISGYNIPYQQYPAQYGSQPSQITVTFNPSPNHGCVFMSIFLFILFNL